MYSTCLFDLACFFLPSHLSLKHVYTQNSESSPSLFRLAAVLLHEELVALGDIYTHVRRIYMYIDSDCESICDDVVIM